MRFFRWLFPVPYTRRRGAEVAGLMAAALGLQVVAAAGMAYVAGFRATYDAFGRFNWPWLGAVAGGLAVASAGYYYAYRGIYAVHEGPRLGGREMMSVVTAGFGGFLSHGGGALDKYALQAAGTGERDASVRVMALGGLEHGVLGLIGCGAAIAVLVMGLAVPKDLSIPWAVIPVPATAAAFVLAERYRARFRARGGWRASMGVFLDVVCIARDLMLRPRRHGAAFAGMAVFWIAEAFAGWAALAAFGFFMNGAALIIGFGTGMVFTRRTGPLAGAGVLMVVLPATIWYSGAPLAAAVAGIFAYRVLSVWLPMPFALASLPTLRAMGQGRAPHTEGTGETAGEPSLRHRDDG